MRKHPLLALFTTTITLTTTGAAGHAFASSDRVATPVLPAAAARSTAVPISSPTTVAFASPSARDALVRAAPLRRHSSARRRPAAVATAVAAVRGFVRSDISAAGPLALDLVLGSRASRDLVTRSARRHADPMVRVLVSAELHASSTRATAVSVPAGGPWLALRTCESGNNYTADTGNGYYGAYQFAPSTWWWIGYAGMPDDASPALQDQAAQRLESRVGWSAWPVCSVVLGLR